MTDFNVRDPTQVVSVGVIDADLGVGNRRLIVASGIVLVSWRYDSDETFRGQERVWLNLYARELEQASAFVGLASIANGESGFVFATDTAKVEVDPNTGELSLVVNTALMGEWSALNRFSYQVVATVVRAASGIAGTISWPTSMFRPESDAPSELQPVLGVMANRHEIVTSAGPFPFERLTPIAPGAIERVTIERERCSASYRVAGPPMAMPLKVTLNVGERFGTAEGVPAVARVAGPDVFTLSPTHPSETVDFAISPQRVIA